MMCVELRIRCSQPPSRGFLGSLLALTDTLPKKPGNAALRGGRALSVDARERTSADESRVFPGLSLLAIFGDHTCRGINLDGCVLDNSCSHFHCTTSAGIGLAGDAILVAVQAVHVSPPVAERSAHIGRSVALPSGAPRHSQSARRCPSNSRRKRKTTRERFRFSVGARKSVCRAR